MNGNAEKLGTHWITLLARLLQTGECGHHRTSSLLRTGECCHPRTSTSHRSKMRIFFTRPLSYISRQTRGFLLRMRITVRFRFFVHMTLFNRTAPNRTELDWLSQPGQFSSVQRSSVSVHTSPCKISKCTKPYSKPVFSVVAF